jgi:hypothetical protein
LKLNENDSPILELFADDTFGRETQPLTIKVQRCFEVVDAKSDNCDSRLHMFNSPSGITSKFRGGARRGFIA